MFANWSLLSLLIWLPIVGGVAVLALSSQRPELARNLSLLITAVVLALGIPLYQGFDNSTAAMQFVEVLPWISALNINYHLGIDGIALPLILLTNFVSLLVVISSWTSITRNVAQYYAAFLILQGLMIGVFCALDAILFYVFFEGMLIPMFVIIGIWGGPRRIYATMKFFLYTFFGSVFMLIALVYLYRQGAAAGAPSFAIADLHLLGLSAREQALLFFAFLIAFAVKIPMWPVHTWLPDAHVEAPTGGSVVLAAIMLKVGGYGFIRFSMPIAPDASAEYAWLLILLSLIAVTYIGFVALVQEDMKKLIAYSSISHMGFVTLGLFIAFALVREADNAQTAALGLQGAMVQMISHGFISAAMFTCVGVMYDRMHSRMIADYGGVVNTMPWFAAFMVLFGMANSGLPGTSGFVGEFMVILASFQAAPWIGLVAALTLIIGAAYTLWLIKRVIFGDIANAEVGALKDVTAREVFVLGAFAFVVLLFGVWPAPLVEMMDASIAELVRQIAVTKLPIQ